MPAETQYTESDGLSIAYQVVGQGPIDLVYVPGFVSHVEYTWELPPYARFLNRLASFSRLILFDKRGTGLSDRVQQDALPTLEQRMDDVRAVMDAAGSERASLFGVSEGSAMCALFAATYPERTRTLALYGTTVTGPSVSDGVTRRRASQIASVIALTRQYWGSAMGMRMLMRVMAPSFANDKASQQWYASFQRLSATPRAAASFYRMNAEVDIRNIVGAIRVPTLILHRTDDRVTPIEHSRYLAGTIPDSRLVELPGRDHFPCAGDMDAILDEVESFTTGKLQDATGERTLCTILFTDIVGSTERAAAMGDRAWRDLLNMHGAAVRREIARFRGREINTEGDGFLATFDGPARGIRCAEAIVGAVRALGLEVRAGVHTGECELMQDDIGGIAVHIAARVMSQAGPGEVVVSRTVKDLVAGSGIRFESRGMHALKGVPDQWQLFAVEQ